MSPERPQPRLRSSFSIGLIWAALLAVALPATTLWAEKVADLPMPTSYVNDFAHVLTPDTQQKIEAECLALHTQVNADVTLVTIKTLDDDQSVEEFTSALEEKWKLGKNGSDRSAIFVIVLNPHTTRIETGYGLEATLPDAMMGRLLDTVTPLLATGDYNGAAMTGIQGLADDIASEQHVVLAPMMVHQYHRETVAAPMSMTQRIVYGVIFVLVLLFLVKTGNLGWGLLLLNMLSGGGGGGGGRDDEGGGGFGGSGGGASGGGGASRDY